MNAGLHSGHYFHANTVIMGHLVTVDERCLPPPSPHDFDLETAALICFSEVQLIWNWNWSPLSVVDFLHHPTPRVQLIMVLYVWEEWSQCVSHSALGGFFLSNREKWVTLTFPFWNTMVGWDSGTVVKTAGRKMWFRQSLRLSLTQ